MSRIAGSARFVWNRVLAEEEGRLDEGRGTRGYAAMCRVLPHLKDASATAFLKEVPSQVLQQKLKDLGRAFRDFFDPKQPEKHFPRFKKKGQHDSFRYPQGFMLEGNQVYLPKIGWIRFFRSRKIEGTPKNVTVTRCGRHWYVSVQVEREIPEPKHPSQSTVGVDLGIARFATLSDGTVYRPRHAFAELQGKLARAQRKLARKKKFSENWKKDKARITRIHERIGNVRRDFLHWVSTRVSKSHATVVIEDLRVRNMSASARGAVEEPGKHVRAKCGLNRAILDQGWSLFRSMLEYKAEWQGGRVIEVDPKYTSQRCPECGHTERANRKSQPRFACLGCGYAEHADLVGARNILAVGHTASACGGKAQLGLPMKQEPRRATSVA